MPPTPMALVIIITRIPAIAEIADCSVWNSYGQHDDDGYSGYGNFKFGNFWVGEFEGSGSM